MSLRRLLEQLEYTALLPNSCQEDKRQLVSNDGKIELVTSSQMSEAIVKAFGGYNQHRKNRVATAQGKQGIWLLTFPDREDTGNLVNLIFYTGKIVATQGKF